MDSFRTAGLHGRLPTSRERVTHNLSPQFVMGWDHWIQRCMPQAQLQLGPAWLEVYLTSPIWRFVLSSGVMGQQLWCGVMMPSVDRGGQYCPLVMAQPLADDVLPTAVFDKAELWFQALEQVALSALTEEYSVVELTQTLDRIPPPDIQQTVFDRTWSVHRPLVIPFENSGQSTQQSFSSVLHELLLQQYPSYSLWWSMGSERVRPVQLVSGHLPSPQCYTALLSGDWEGCGWDIPFTLHANKDNQNE